MRKSPPVYGITPALITQHIKVLASDEYQGRRPFTAGEEKATTYQHPETGSFYRSDHFSFAKVGMPALYASGSFDSRLPGKAFAEKERADFEAKNYHQPSDQFNPKWDLRGAAQDTRLRFRIGQKLASETTFPQWKPGSEFRAVRLKSRPQ